MTLNQKVDFHFSWVLGLVSIIAMIIVLYLVNINLGIENFSNTVSLPVYTIIPGTLVILSIWAVTRSKTIKELPRKSLIFLALGFTFWFLAEQTWNLYEHVFMIDPYPSLADVFYILAPIFMFISLSLFLKSTGKKISKKNVLIASIISLIILIPALTTTLEVGSEDELIEIITALSYPIADAFLLVPAIITILFLISNKKSFFWLMIIAGIILMLTADSIFLFAVINDDYEDGHPVDILWVSSYTIWSFMMYYIIAASKKEKEENTIYEKFGSKKTQKYGILVGLILINSAVAILLAGINYSTNPDLENTTLAFFSWIFIMTVIIFSSIIIILNSQLNKTLQNRTSQLEKTSNELIKAERFSAVGELASRVSHDIRNPLSNIKMSIELMKNSPPDTKINDKKINEKLELATKNIERISHQVDNVLEFVKNRKLKKETFKISTCLHEAIESMQIPSNIKIKLPKSDTSIFADNFQIQIVFNNIIMNAIQAIGKNYGEIIIKIFEKNDEIIIKVEDSGPDISKDVLEHVFDTLITTKQVGTGLGLASCKTIIENHKGTISAQNEPVTFTITLPKNEI